MSALGVYEMIFLNSPLSDGGYNWGGGKGGGTFSEELWFLWTLQRRNDLGRRRRLGSVCLGPLDRWGLAPVGLGRLPH